MVSVGIHVFAAVTKIRGVCWTFGQTKSPERRRLDENSRKCWGSVGEGTIVQVHLGTKGFFKQKKNECLYRD